MTDPTAAIDELLYTYALRRNTTKEGKRQEGKKKKRNAFSEKTARTCNVIACQHGKRRDWTTWPHRHEKEIIQGSTDLTRSNSTVNGRTFNLKFAFALLVLLRRGLDSCP